MNTSANTLTDSTDVWGTDLLITALETALVAKIKKQTIDFGTNFGFTFILPGKKGPKLNPTFDMENSSSITLSAKPKILYQDSKRPSFFAIFACVSNFSSSFQKIIPISINNSLLSVHVSFGEE